ncbi:MAG: polyphosphate polymerase domain-containing protein [Bacteroidales bacterium]|nr:polyphosphate polymerase domain-containing protein [Bacteroidales bacterium]
MSNLVNLNNILSQYNGISLSEMDSVSLLDRMDSKFVFSAKLLPEILVQAKDNYKVLTIDKERIFSYRSLYFDTSDNKMYLDHHNGRLNRYKVRIRTYINTGISFLEIKFKTKNGRTLKKRIKTDNIDAVLTDESRKFISENMPISAGALEPKIYSTFLRLTLVDNKLSERVTIDYDLGFENGSHNKTLSNLAIAEVKHDGKKIRFLFHS